MRFSYNKLSVIYSGIAWLFDIQLIICVTYWIMIPWLEMWYAITFSLWENMICFSKNTKQGEKL